MMVKLLWGVRALIILLGSWVVVHVLAVLGIFLALAYPIWSLLLPIAKRPRVQTPPLLATAKRSALILVLSLLSIGVVAAEAKILAYFGLPPTPKTVSFQIPTRGQYKLGETFVLPIAISGVKTPINAVQADLSFDVAKLEVIEVSTEGSFANIFVQKEINNTAGFVRLTGGLPSPGYSGDQGIFGSVYFRTKEPGVAAVTFNPTSMILANDTKGTNVLKDFATVSYLVLPERLVGEQATSPSQAVLGESTSDSPQMIFYPEEALVLGTETENTGSEEVPQEDTEELWTQVLTYFAQFDQMVVEGWLRAVGMVK